MRIVFLVPRRDDGGQRDRLWAWCRARWTRYLPDWSIYEGHHDEGPFNRSAAVNRAARLADADGPWDMAVIIDSDVFLRVSQVTAAVGRASETGRVTWAHRRWRGITKHWTERFIADNADFGPELAGVDWDIHSERVNPISWSCCIAVPRPVWDAIGGMDERFSGWGFEDMAWQSLIVGLFGHERIDIVPGDEVYPPDLQRKADVLHLFHERSEERLVKGRPAYTATPEYITNARLGRRYMVAARRDHGMHDRSDVAAPDEMERDIANLQLDDAKLSTIAQRLGLPDWDDWWPPLEELLEGARSFRDGPAPTIAVVVHSGGDADEWPQRREYLRRSLDSLVAQVSGSIVQRRVYAVWPTEEIRAEVRAIAEPLEFTVVGPEPREWQPGHPWSRSQLWRYLGRRVTAEYIFGTEDDFLYDRPVDLDEMARQLRAIPHVRQLALLRGPYYPKELAAGGIIEQHPERYERVDGRIEHRDHFTNNPSLYRASLPRTTVLAPVASSEVQFAKQLNLDPRSRFAYLGDGTPWVSHIGQVRAGRDY